jgi:hypothetical protein
MLPHGSGGSNGQLDEKDPRVMTRIRSFVATVVAALALLSLAPASAQQPSNPVPALRGLSSGQVVSDRDNKSLVIDSRDDSVGHVGRSIVNHSGAIEAYVVCVGGFFGIGTKPVALAIGHFVRIPTTKPIKVFQIPFSLSHMKGAEAFAEPENGC